jgi:hypothetical protein
MIDTVKKVFSIVQSKIRLKELSKRLADGKEDLERDFASEIEGFCIPAKNAKKYSRRF